MLLLSYRFLRCRLINNAIPLMIFLIVLGFINLPLTIKAKGETPASVDNPRCSEPRDKGVPCPHDGTAPSKQFYYNAHMGVCQPFMYKGCEGNSNRFESADECKNTCAREKQDVWVLAHRCNANHLIPDGHYIECSHSSQSCPQGHNCRERICCPSKELVCSLQDDSGTFAEGVPDKPRFAWNADIHSCWRFSYYGSKGNYNNFPSFQECVAFCNTIKVQNNNGSTFKEVE